MLQRSDLVAQAVIGKGGEIIPPGIFRLCILQNIQGLLVSAEADVLLGCILVLVAGLLLAAVTTVTAITSVTTVAAVATIAAISTVATVITI